LFAALHGEGSLPDNTTLAVLVDLARAGIIDGLESVDGAALERAGVEELTSVATLVPDSIVALSECWNCDCCEFGVFGGEAAVGLGGGAAVGSLCHTLAGAGGVKVLNDFTGWVAALGDCGVEWNTGSDGSTALLDIGVDTNTNALSRRRTRQDSGGLATNGHSGIDQSTGDVIGTIGGGVTVLNDGNSETGVSGEDYSRG